MGFFSKKSKAPKRIRVKRGFRISKATQHIYEVEIQIEYKGRNIGIVPVNVSAPSRAKAKAKVSNEVTFKPEKIKRIK